MIKVVDSPSIGRMSGMPNEGGEGNKDLLLPFDNDILNEDYILYKYRFFNLALYCLASMLNQMCWISLQPVADAVSNAYQIDATSVNTISLVYMGVYLIMNFPSNYIIDRWGCRVGVSDINDDDNRLLLEQY